MKKKAKVQEVERKIRRAIRLERLLKEAERKWKELVPVYTDDDDEYAEMDDPMANHFACFSPYPTIMSSYVQDFRDELQRLKRGR